MACSGKKLQIAIPIFAGLTALDAVGPYEVLHFLPNAEIVFVSHKLGPVSADREMLKLHATASLDEVTKPDILLVPGGNAAYVESVIKDEVFLDWIRKVHENTVYTTSVCTGAMFLAAAGLLKGLEATTHWAMHDNLAEYGAKPVWSRVVHQGKIITAAGVSSGIDMALTLVSFLTDVPTAETVQLLIEYDPQPPFDKGSKAKAGPELVNRAMELAAKLSQLG